MNINELSNLILNRNLILLESQFPKDYTLGEKITEILSENNFVIKDQIIHNDNLILYSEDMMATITTSKLSGNILTYEKFCKKNQNLTSNLRIFQDCYIYVKNYDITTPMYLEYQYSELTNLQLKNDIINYFNWFKTKDYEEPEVNQNAKRLIDSLNFDGISIDDINIQNSIAIRYDGALILDKNCFDGKNKVTKKSLNNAIKNSKYPEDLISYLEQNNFTKEGEGVYGAVYSSDKIVIKIDKGQKDPAYMNFYNFCKTHNNDHLPSFGKIIEIDGFYVLPMEKLQHGSSRNFRYLCDWMQDMSTADKVTQEKIYDDIPRDYLSQRDSLIDVINDLKSYKNNGHHFDLHSNNIMLRGNTVVITDPYAMS